MIFTWFRGWSRNVGGEMGLSGLLVIDEDQPDAFAKYAADHGGQMPPTFTVKTTNGRHYYFQDSVGGQLGNTEGALGAYGINVRSGNAYIVGPGSVHATGAVYTVEAALPVAPLPDWVVEAIRGKPRQEPITDTRCPLPKRFSIQTLADTSASPRSSRTTTGTTHSWGTRAPCGPGTSR
jgi:hypothetical protein